MFLVLFNNLFDQLLFKMFQPIVNYSSAFSRAVLWLRKFPREKALLCKCCSTLFQALAPCRVPLKCRNFSFSGQHFNTDCVEKTDVSLDTRCQEFQRKRMWICENSNNFVILRSNIKKMYFIGKIEFKVWRRIS